MPGKKEIHPYEKAKEVVKALGIKSKADYRRLYTVSAMLPSEPMKKYPEWEGWDAFCGIEPPEYHTYAQAKDAVRSLGISSVPQYRARYKEDPKLPPAPDVFYAEYWDSWPTFFSKSQYQEKYFTIEKASAAAIKLGIRTKEQYQQKYTEDSDLPSTPNKMYAETWEGWEKFLGTDVPV